jgi:hypothetical protein
MDQRVGTRGQDDASGKNAFMSRSMFWFNLIFAGIMFLFLTASAIALFVRAGGDRPVDLLRVLGLPSMVLLLAVGAIVNVKRILSTVTQDPTVLRGVASVGLLVLGFCFMTMQLLMHGGY